MRRSLACGLLIMLAAGSALASENLPEPFEVIPQPKKVVLREGPGLEPAQLECLVLVGETPRPVVGHVLSRLPLGRARDGGSLTLTLDGKNPSLTSDEAYILTVGRGRAEVAAKGEAGLFYGCQTLEQLLEDAADHKVEVPSCVITDFPVLPFRAVHFDVKHHLDHLNAYYDGIDRLAKYKINAVVFEFEDKLRYQRQPLVGAPQAISIDEMAALTRYARDRQIEIIPLVQGLGHATFILKHQAYANLRELPWNRWAFCPLHEGTYQVLFDLYRDAIRATPGSKYLHIGGDEIGNIGLCPRCKPMADRQGMLSLSLYWLKRVCEFAAENGRTPIFWDDMPLKEAGVYETTYKDDVKPEEAARRWAEGTPKLDKLLEHFPKNCVYMRWNYSMATQPGNIQALDWYKTRGLKAMVATATNAEGGPLFQEDDRDSGPSSTGIIIIRSFLGLAAEKGIGGMLCTAWDDRSPHLENYWRGFIASAEYSWSPDGRTLEDYDRAWLQREFGLSVPDYKSFHDQLRRGSAFWYRCFLRQGSRMDEDNALQRLDRLEHWRPADGQEKTPDIDPSTKLIGLPDPASPGAWTREYRDRLEAAQVEIDGYPVRARRLRELHEAARRNRYYWELALALHDLQATAPRLLLALKRCDEADTGRKEAGAEQVKAALMGFQTAWAAVQRVYGKTRFLAYPENYVPDRYFHFASQREDLSWMIQVEELYHGLIGKWLTTLPVQERKSP